MDSLVGVLWQAQPCPCPVLAGLAVSRSLGSQRKRAHNLANNLKYKLKEYGLTLEEYKQINEAQGGVCAICGQPEEPRLHVDHDHETGVVRGLLCKRCNLGIGYLMDSVENLEAAIRYLSGGQT